MTIQTDIHIGTNDVFGNRHYIQRIDGQWRAVLANGIQYNLGQAAGIKDETLLRIKLSRLDTADEAVALLTNMSAAERPDSSTFTQKFEVV